MTDDMGPDYYADGLDDDGPECCWSCHGEGWIHDCGEDTCCCANPEEDDIYPCEECGGSGEL